MKNRITKAGTEADSTTKVEETSVRQTIAKPLVIGSVCVCSCKKRDPIYPDLCYYCANPYIE